MTNHEEAGKQMKKIVPICQNGKCRKSLAGKRKDAKFCSPLCGATARAAEKPEGVRESWISQACHFPRQVQAVIVKANRRHRHPVSGKRPEWSGYCVVPERCECKCHAEVS